MLSSHRDCVGGMARSASCEQRHLKGIRDRFDGTRTAFCSVQEGYKALRKAASGYLNH